MFIHFSQRTFNMVYGALLLALAGCDVSPPHMKCAEVDGAFECTCKFVYADCDNNPLNGCETNTATDANHCGACGNVCAFQNCLNGKCVCDDANCFCADLATDENNCGSCGNSVRDWNACTTDTCVSGNPTHTNVNAGAWCYGGVCNGEGTCLPWNGPCTTKEDCASGFCVDGVCCESACAGTCEACAQAQTGEQNGQCRPILYFLDPVEECLNGVCDGSGQCTLPGIACTTSAECPSGFCADGFCCDSPCTETCMTCNRGGNEGTCVPVPMFEDDANATPPCNGATLSCNGSGVCKGDMGQTCVTNAECLNGNCDGGSCGESVNQPGPLVWEWHQDTSSEFAVNAQECYFDFDFGGPYPSLGLSTIVARSDGSVTGLGTYFCPMFGMPSGGRTGGSASPFYCHQTESWDEDYRGPHPFMFDIDANGNNISLERIDEVRSSSYTCDECTVQGVRSFGLLWPSGGDVGRYRTRWNCGPDTAYFCPQSMSLTSCDFGELTKSASPQWSLGTVDVCAMPVWKIAGDDLGNTIVASSTSLTKYDPSGQVNKVMPDPFGGVVLLDNVEENPLALGPQGEIYLGGRTNTEIRLAKADASGILQWSNSVPTPNDSEPKCFSYALDKSGNILVAFNAASVVDLGNGPMPRLGTKDLILAKLDPQSNVIWAKRFGGPGFDAQSCSLRRTGADDIALVLGYAGMVDLGDGALQSSPVLAKFDAMGTIVWHADLATRFPLLPADEQHWVLTGHPSGAVMVSGSGTHHYPSGKNPSGASRYLDLQFVVAKYGP